MTGMGRVVQQPRPQYAEGDDLSPTQGYAPGRMQYQGSQGARNRGNSSSNGSNYLSPQSPGFDPNAPMQHQPQQARLSLPSPRHGPMRDVGDPSANYSYHPPVSSRANFQRNSMSSPGTSGYRPPQYGGTEAGGLAMMPRGPSPGIGEGGIPFGGTGAMGGLPTAGIL